MRLTHDDKAYIGTLAKAVSFRIDACRAGGDYTHQENSDDISLEKGFPIVLAARQSVEAQSGDRDRDIRLE